MKFFSKKNVWTRFLYSLPACYAAVSGPHGTSCFLAYPNDRFPWCKLTWWGLCSYSPKILAKHANPFIPSFWLDTLLRLLSQGVMNIKMVWGKASQHSPLKPRSRVPWLVLSWECRNLQEVQWGESAMCSEIMAETWFSMSSPPRNPRNPTTLFSP